MVNVHYHVNIWNAHVSFLLLQILGTAAGSVNFQWIGAEKIKPKSPKTSEVPKDHC